MDVTALRGAFKMLGKACELAFTEQMVLPLSTPDAFTIIDRADYELVACRPWYRLRNANNAYALTGSRHTGTRAALHRFLLDAPEGLEVDHIDGDGLNNSRSNLRLATRTQNSANRGKNRNNRSGFKGVTFYKRTGKWMAQIGVDGKNVHLGYYGTPEEAAEAYDKAALAAWGPYARLNFPLDEAS